MSLRDDTVRRVTAQLDRLISHHGELKLAIHNKKNEAILESELVTQFVLQAAVLWESFQNDLLLDYIEMRPSRALSSLEVRIKSSVRDKYGPYARRAILFSPPSSPSRTVLEGLLDHRGWNISAKSAEALATKANALLLSRFAKRFSLAREDSEFYDYVISLRNFLSHYSSGARTELKAKTVALSESVNVPLKSSVGKIGRYLKSDGGTGVSRAIYVLRRMQGIAQKL